MELSCALANHPILHPTKLHNPSQQCRCLFFFACVIYTRYLCTMNRCLESLVRRTKKDRFLLTVIHIHTKVPQLLITQHSYLRVHMLHRALTYKWNELIDDDCPSPLDRTGPAVDYQPLLHVGNVMTEAPWNQPVSPSPPAALRCLRTNSPPASETLQAWLPANGNEIPTTRNGDPV